MVITVVEFGHVVQSKRAILGDATETDLCSRTDFDRSDVYCAVLWALAFGRFVFLKRQRRAEEVTYDPSATIGSVDASSERSDDRSSFILFLVYLYQLVRILAGARFSHCALGGWGELDSNTAAVLTDALYFGCAHFLADTCVRFTNDIYY
ncbi:hypothetical protein CYMTET_2848 [Cymbomonas tetramitiformis]|uniref:Uncharacterized protein n=1 Tax=Cymbomonas tetramitiformis TaxID=36881 RepID=A0AAE0H498_9CHLO|nr:hypothetical protein CYMTET_2848 [Cymbomonas tetramitiformis]